MTEPETRRRKEDRATVHVRRSVEKRLIAYTAAASASLVSVQSAAAKVIYTPVNLTIETGTVPLDLNHDGAVDFNLVERFSTSRSGAFGHRTLNVNGAGNPGAGVLASRYGSAGALALGAEIGPGEHFLRVQNANALIANVRNSVWTTTYRFCFGAFVGGTHTCAGTTDRFLGLRFEVNGNTYYGWAGFSVVKVGFWPPWIHARLVGVAYEDVAGQPIRAGQLQDSDEAIKAAPNPQPGTLGLLALGAQGLDIWRPRKRELTAK